MTDNASPRPRKHVSSAASCLTTLVAFAALATLCCSGLSTLGLRATTAAQARLVEERVEELRERVRLRHACEALIDEIALRLDAQRDVERAYPRALPEAPPPDPWGTELEYESGGPDRAWLRSAGPDRAFGTADDVVRPLVGR